MQDKAGRKEKSAETVTWPRGTQQVSVLVKKYSKPTGKPFQDSPCFLLLSSRFLFQDVSRVDT